jgi:hypothetical protein
LTVSYDAASQSYTITAAHASQSFRPQDRDDAASDANATRYSRTNGTVTDTLILTKAGDSGAFNYRYVGAGIQRQRDTAGGVDQNRFNAFTYGVRTADAAVPTSGTGSFAVGITGLQVRTDAVSGYDGSGLLTVDFANRTFTGSGIVTVRYPTSTVGYYVPSFDRFTMTGNSGSGTNVFSGSIELGTVLPYVAALDGRFYGPAAEEVGAAFAGLNAANQTFVGAIIGRRGNVAPGYETLGSLLTPVSLQQLSSGLRYTDNGGGASFGSVTFTGQGMQSQFLINPSPLTYSNGNGIFNLGPNNKVAAESDARFTTYRFAPLDSYRIYNVGSGNEELVLSYASFGQRHADAGTGQRIDEAFIFGLESNHHLLPRSGHGLYQGVLHGSAVGSGNNADRFALTGTAGFDFDFGGGSFTGVLNPTATNLRTNAASSLGTFNFANGVVPGFNGMSVAFFGDIVGAPGATGRINGRFYGPNAQEIGGVFSLTTPGAGTVLTAVGAVVGKAQ